MDDRTSKIQQYYSYNGSIRNNINYIIIKNQWYIIIKYYYGRQYNTIHRVYHEDSFPSWLHNKFVYNIIIIFTVRGILF